MLQNAKEGEDLKDRSVAGVCGCRSTMAVVRTHHVSRLQTFSSLPPMMENYHDRPRIQRRDRTNHGR